MGAHRDSSMLFGWNLIWEVVDKNLLMGGSCFAQTFQLVHRGLLSSRMLGGSRGKLSTMGTP